MPKSSDYDTSYTQDRELSWLRFNARVLDEADDENVPLYERLKFASIFTSNLDEFFMIRVGSLFDLSLLKQVHIDNKTGMTPAQQLARIYTAVEPLYKRRDKVVARIEEHFKREGVARLTMKELAPPEKKFAEKYFQENIRPLLSPQIVDVRHPFPHLQNKALYAVLQLKSKDGGQQFGIVPLPDSVPRVLFLPGGSMRYLLTERLLLEYADAVFDRYTVQDKTVIAVTRNADINPDDETYEVADDYRKHMKKVLKKRSRLAPVRLEVQQDIGVPLRDFLAGKLELKKEQIYKSKTPLDLSYVFGLPERFPDDLRERITYPPYEPQIPPGVNPSESMFRQVQKQDLLLFYPYESMEPFLQLVREAANDPNVLSIKMTIYRLASKSRLAEYLAAAAENGKDVQVLMELRARFDEQNNINWSEVLEDAGCQVNYGFEDFKTHSKICLITRRERGQLQYITQVGTGNYNEKTSKLYTDYCLVTCDPEIGADAADFFQDMSTGCLEGNYRELLAAPNTLKPGLMALIDEQIGRAARGEEARVFIKANSVTDRELIDKLSEASCAGVHVDLIIRGICCILPGVPGRTENVRVRSIVGRYLEHSRVYAFRTDDDWKLYISSADFMTRNTTRRVEVACPVKDQRLRRRILLMMQTMLSDNVKARQLDSDGEYDRLPQVPPLVDCQQAFMEQAVEAAQSGPEIIRRGRRWFSQLLHSREK